LNDYIWLNGKLFCVTEIPKHSKTKSGVAIDYSLNNTLQLDLLPSSIKGKWTFNFHIDDRELARLESIWSLKSSCSLKDIDGKEYTVV
jgi:hypothetical protein